MCGRFNVIDSPEVRWLCETLGVPLTGLRISVDVAPGGVISILHQQDDKRQLTDATWWLMLDPENLKPNYKYASFNSRSDKLHVKRSLAYQPYRSSRCIIPASAFVEGLGDKKTYHKIELQGSAIAFGGLYKEYIHKTSGERVLAASIITLPPLMSAWETIHPKSMPLLLPYEDQQLMDKWLDPQFSDLDLFQPLLENPLAKAMIITPIDRPAKWNPIANSFIIESPRFSWTLNRG